jgi:hypothetical protein
MTPFAAFATRTVGAAATAALLSLGIAAGVAQAAGPSPKSTPTAAAPAAPAGRTARRAIVRAVFESEADVLGIAPKMLRADLKAGQKVSDLAKGRGMTEAQFAAKLIASARPRLETLVDHKVITQAQADKEMDRISKDHIPFWNGVQRRK